MARQILLQKAEEAQEIKSLLGQYRAVGVAGLQKVRSTQLQELRRKLENAAYLRVIKNNLVRRAIADLKNKPEIEKIDEYLSGSNIFLFTNLNPFKLVMLLERSRVKTIAKAGDVAVGDVVAPAGNTGLPPGPIISQLGAVGLPTRIEAGSVWINRDTLVAKEGEVISPRLAAVLSKLGVKAAEVGLTLKAVYDDGMVITKEQLRIDLSEVRRSIEEAHVLAFNLSFNAVYPLPENVVLLLQTARQRACNLALNAGVPTPDTMADLLRKAHTEMLSLSSRLAAIDKKAAPMEPAQKG